MKGILGTAAVGATVAILAAGASATNRQALVLWHQICPFNLGQSRARIEYDFGARVRSNDPNDFDLGYRVDGGFVGIEYDSGNHITSLETASSQFQTSTGFGVGSRIPLGACHRVNGACVYHWHGLTYDPGIGWWRGAVSWGKARVGVTIVVQRGVVVSLSMAKVGLIGHSVAASAAERREIVSFIKQTPASGCATATCRVTTVRLAASDRSYALVGIYDPNVGAGDLVLHRIRTRWRIASGPGTSDVGCGDVPPQILGDLGLSCSRR